MQRTLFIAAVTVFLLFSGSMVLAQQQSANQGNQPQGQGWFCPWCGGQDYGQPGQGMGPGMMHRGYGMGQGWQGRGMGPGMMHGQGMGPGMMHRGYGMGQGWQGQGMMHGRQGQGMGPGMRGNQWGRGQYGPPSGQQQQQQQQQQMGPMNQNTAQELAQNYVAGNPNLKVGDVSEQDDVYVARIVTQDGSLVEKLLIDKETGWMKRAY